MRVGNWGYEKRKRAGGGDTRRVCERVRGGKHSIRFPRNHGDPVFARMTICHLTSNGLFTRAFSSGDFRNNMGGRDEDRRARVARIKDSGLRIRDSDLKKRWKKRGGEKVRRGEFP